MSGTLTDATAMTVASRTVLRIDDGNGLHDDHVIFKDGRFETQVLAGEVRFRIENLLDVPEGAWKQLDGLPFDVAPTDSGEPVLLPRIRVQIDGQSQDSTGP